jgi:hypothetical protein
MSNQDEFGRISGGFVVALIRSFLSRLFDSNDVVWPRSVIIRQTIWTVSKSESLLSFDKHAFRNHFRSVGRNGTFHQLSSSKSSSDPFIRPQSTVKQKL